MGYTTEFYGALTITPPIDDQVKHFINQLNQTRRMKRDAEQLEKLGFCDDYGVDGEFFVQENAIHALGFNDMTDPTIVNINQPPATQPGLWMQWCINDEGELVWDEGEKFYESVAWLQYLIDRIFEPAGYKLNGRIECQGENHFDHWFIHVTDNCIAVR